LFEVSDCPDLSGLLTATMTIACCSLIYKEKKKMRKKENHDIFRAKNNLQQLILTRRSVQL
jgi:hypothetical protein